MEPDADRTPPGQTAFTIPEAARVLGISEEAVRGRIKRDTLKSVKVGGRTHALLDADRTRQDSDRTGDQATREPESSALTSALRERIDSLERQLEAERQANSENRRIIVALANKVPQLEAPPEPRESHESPAPERVDSPTPEQRGPWWRRWFQSR
jgi:hypothetical protein